MTVMTVLPQQPAKDRPIAGVSEVELEVMVAAALRLFAAGGVDGVDAAVVTGELAVLAEPADGQAAGRVSQRRDDYWKMASRHMMAMPYRAR